MSLKIEEMMLQCFQQILRIRMIEENIAKKYSEQKMRCPVHFSIGQEAIAVGVCKALLKTDYLISNHRAHAHYLAKGGSLKRMIAELYGKVDGCTAGKGGSMHLIDLEANVIGATPILAGSIPVGVGVAFSSFLKKEDHITVIFFGDAATEEGTWTESLNFASLKKLPILFVCENNFYSCYSPLSDRQHSERSRLQIARAHGISAFSGDGNKVEEVFEIAKQAVRNIREGRGPCFVEFETYRSLEHCGPNFDAKDLRPEKEEVYWRSKCPLKWSERQMRSKNLLTDELLESYKNEINSEIKQAFHFAEKSKFPVYHPEEDVYA